MKLTSNSFANGARIPERFAFGVRDPQDRVAFGGNLNPHLHWTEVPEGTRSFAVICHDSEAPSVADDVNVEGRTVPFDLPRADFFHWLLVDIPVDMRELPEGDHSERVTPHGKPVGGPAYGRSGQNDYTGWFAGNAEMEGTYRGYDGPGPPWNDERVHLYHFTVYALDTDRLPLPESFGGEDVRRALAGHMLDQAEWMGSYSLYPGAREP